MKIKREVWEKMRAEKRTQKDGGKQQKSTKNSDLEFIKEFTFEITNYCPHSCKYCSSSSTKVKRDAFFLDKKDVLRYVFGKRFGRINLSGGEPLAHPQFYDILRICKQAAEDVVVYTNALTHIRYNAQVIDGIYLDANLTLLPNVDEVHVLKRVKHGKEAKRPEVFFSKNYEKQEKCRCHQVMRPNGKIDPTPCQKSELK